MTTVTIVAALLAIALAVAGWRLQRRVLGAAAAALLAVTLSVMFMSRTSGDGAGGAAPDGWLVDSALAFNRPAAVASAATAAMPLPGMAKRLAARLEREPDDAAGWSLLAATYRQLAQGEDAARAAERAVAAGGDPEAFIAMHGEAMGGAAAIGPTPVRASMVSAGSAEAAAFVMEGQRLRRERKFAEAAVAYRQALELDPLDADSWADLADAAGAAAGHDLGASRDAIAKALAIDPEHRKALWLRASLELQEGRYSEAARTWRHLQGLVQPGSADARVIAANIEEANTLAASARQGG